MKTPKISGEKTSRFFNSLMKTGYIMIAGLAIGGYLMHQYDTGQASKMDQAAKSAVQAALKSVASPSTAQAVADPKSNGR